MRQKFLMFRATTLFKLVAILSMFCCDIGLIAAAFSPFFDTEVKAEWHSGSFLDELRVTCPQANDKYEEEYNPFLSPFCPMLFIYDRPYRTLPIENIKSAIASVEKQGPYGSCVINSIARALALLDINLDYQDFLMTCSLAAVDGSWYKYLKQQINSVEKDEFFSSMFASGTKPSGACRFLNRILIKGRYDLLGLEFRYQVLDSFYDVKRIIEEEIAQGKPVLASFRFGKDKKKKVKSTHFMNIVGYRPCHLNVPNWTNFRSKYLILNTWGGNSMVSQNFLA